MESAGFGLGGFRANCARTASSRWARPTGLSNASVLTRAVSGLNARSHFVAVSDSYLRGTMTKREDNVFDPVRGVTSDLKPRTVDEGPIATDKGILWFKP